MNGRCVFRALWGIYCPGCGGTRALYCLLTGHPILSLWYNPIVLYIAGVAAAILFSRLLAAASKDRTRIVRFHTRYVYIGLVILLLNWLVKNYILLKTGMAPIP